MPIWLDRAGEARSQGSPGPRAVSARRTRPLGERREPAQGDWQGSRGYRNLAPRITGEGAGNRPPSAHWETETSGVRNPRSPQFLHAAWMEKSALEANGLWQRDG